MEIKPNGGKSISRNLWDYKKHKDPWGQGVSCFRIVGTYQYLYQLKAWAQAWVQPQQEEEEGAQKK